MKEEKHTLLITRDDVDKSNQLHCDTMYLYTGGLGTIL